MVLTIKSNVVKNAGDFNVREIMSLLLAAIVIQFDLQLMLISSDGRKEQNL